MPAKDHLTAAGDHKGSFPKAVPPRVGWDGPVYLKGSNGKALELCLVETKAGAFLSVDGVELDEGQMRMLSGACMAAWAQTEGKA